MLPNTPKFTWNAGTNEFIPSRPARYWNPADETVGGSRTSAAGVPASYIVRRDALVDVPIRFTEAEWPEVRDLVAFGQSKQILTWFPDSLESESFAVYLESPEPGVRFAPSRSGEYPRDFEMTLILRGAGTVPWRPFFP